MQITEKDLDLLKEGISEKSVLINGAMIDLSSVIKGFNFLDIIEKKKKEKDDFIKAIEIVVDKLRDNKEYYKNWKDCITMSIRDNYVQNIKFSIDVIANKAADNFLNILITSIKHDNNIPQ